MIFCALVSIFSAGFPKEQAQKWADEKIELYIEEKGPITHWTWKSKYTPVDMSFKFDEQFEFFDAYLKEKVKCVASKNNKRMKMLSQSSHGCWESKITAGDDFMVFVSIDSHSHFRILKTRLIHMLYSKNSRFLALLRYP